MGTSGSETRLRSKVAHAQGSGTILTYRPLLQADRLCEAVLNDVPNPEYGDAFRGLGLTKVSFWIQRNPDAAMVRWEGADIDSLFDRFETSPNQVLAKWRGLLRVFSGPVVADGYWNAPRHRVFCWTTGEEGEESEIMVHRQPKRVEAFLELADNFQSDPSLLGILDRVRRSQGFTRIETWHQRTNEEDVMLTLVEAHDLKDARAQMEAETNELDQRTMQVVRSSMLEPSIAQFAAKLLTTWRA